MLCPKSDGGDQNRGQMLGLQFLVCLFVLAGATYGKLLHTLRSGQLSIAEKPPTLEGSDGILCTIIGFDTAVSSKLKGRIFSAEEFKGSRAQLNEIHDYEKLASSELLAPVGIVFMPRLDAIAGGGRFLNQVAAYEMNLKNSRASEVALHIIVEDGAFTSKQAAEEWVRNAVREVAPPRCKINVRTVSSPS